MNGEIESVDKKLDKYVLRSKVNKVVAVGMGLVFGSLAFSSWVHALPSNGAENASSLADSKLADTKLKTPLSDSLLYGDKTENFQGKLAEQGII